MRRHHVGVIHLTNLGPKPWALVEFVLPLGARTAVLAIAGSERFADVDEARARMGEVNAEVDAFVAANPLRTLTAQEIYGGNQAHG